MDLSWKLLQRTLKDILTINPGLIRTKEDMFRVAAEYELITNTERWLGHYFYFVTFINWRGWLAID
ncbi:MAG: hypothetical protein HQL83_09350 [Magnetococcales bacterium]|nr:hypothetical protein [Magnetococcales bacterium]